MPQELRKVPPVELPEPEDESFGERPPRTRRRWPWVVAAVVALALVIFLANRGDGSAGEGGRGPGGRPDGGPTPVRAAAVERGSLRVTGQYPGELTGEAVELAPKVSGRLLEVRVRAGDRIGRGGVVAVLDPADLARGREEEAGQLAVADAARQRAAALLEEAVRDLERARQLHDQQLLSRQDLDRAEARAGSARAELAAAAAQIDRDRARLAQLDQQLGDTRLVAPFAGVVAERYLDAGALVQPGTPVVRLVEEGSLLVQFRVPERALRGLDLDAPLAVTTQATGDTLIRGEVARIAGEVSRSDRTVLVEGSLVAPPAAARPGMYAEVEVVLERLEDRLLIPGAALVERVGPEGLAATGVFTVAGGEGEARWRPVEVLGREGGRVAVSGQLAAGDVVLTLGHEELSAGSLVRIVEGPGAVPRDPAGADAAGPAGGAPEGRS
ncbi:MAG TPA: efflux RND transporter periplasmic adaptor subunit [Thermoanaerobaculia bacterium]|nr:efflux RND transporter periplasmic adaptor subunit [Thermoanaerobaculia bacterium]